MLKRLMDIAGGLVGEYAEYIAGLSDRKVIMQIEDRLSVKTGITIYPNTFEGERNKIRNRCHNKEIN